MRVDASSRKDTLLRFDVGGLGGAPVASARLRLHALTDAPGGGDVYALPNTAWSESVVTWNTVPAAGGLLGSVGPIVAGGWYEVDVTALVAGGVPPGGAVAVRVASSDASSADYTSKEHFNGFAPELVIDLGGAPAQPLSASISDAPSPRLLPAPRPGQAAALPPRLAWLAPRSLACVVRGGGGSQKRCGQGPVDSEVCASTRACAWLITRGRTEATRASSRAAATAG